MSDELQQLIAHASKIAFEAGRRAETGRYQLAINEMKCENHIGEYVYLNDLEDKLADLRKGEK